MNWILEIMLVLFTIGFLSQAINDLGVFGDTQVIPNYNYSLETSSVQEINSNAASATVDDFTLVTVIWMFLHAITSGILAMFTIIPLCVSIFQMVGVDSSTSYILAGVIQAPLTLITLFGLYELYTGRPVL